MRTAQILARMFVLLTVVIVFIWGCGSPVEVSGPTGSVSFNIRWPSQNRSGEVAGLEMGPGTDLIQIRVYQNGVELTDKFTTCTPPPTPTPTPMFTPVGTPVPPTTPSPTVVITGIPIGMTRFVATAHDPTHRPPLFNAWGTIQVLVRSGFVATPTLTMTLVTPTPLPNTAPGAEIQLLPMRTGDTVAYFTCEAFDMDDNLDRMEIMYNYSGFPPAFVADDTFPTGGRYAYWAPSHDYTLDPAGTYIVGLRAVDALGLDSITTVQVVIPAP